MDGFGLFVGTDPDKDKAEAEAESRDPDEPMTAAPSAWEPRSLARLVPLLLLESSRSCWSNWLNPAPEPPPVPPELVLAAAPIRPL